MGYDISEASRLVSWQNSQAGVGGITEEQLRCWLDAGIDSVTWDDVWGGRKYIGFRTLVSLRLIVRLHSLGVSLDAVAKAAPKLRQELGVKWPFASKYLWRDSPGYPFSPENASDLQPASDVLEFDEDGIACAWRPAEGVLIHPDIFSGSPCVAGTRIATWIIGDMARGGDSAEEIADWYELPEERVKNALEWERQLAACGT